MVEKIWDIILWVFELFIYCLILPLGLGVSWLIVGALSELLDYLYATAFQHVTIYYGLSIVVGVLVFWWRKKEDRKK